MALVGIITGSGFGSLSVGACETLRVKRCLPYETLVEDLGLRVYCLGPIDGRL